MSHIPPAAGERRAIGGYYSQYRIASELILRQLRDGTLLWIRVADPEAGRVEADRREAAAFGFEGTPAFLVGGIALNGAYPENEFAKILSFIRKTPQVSRDGLQNQPPFIEKARH